MFIAHGEKVRKHARWIMAGVLILLIPGFVALFTTTGQTDRGGGQLPTIRGKAVDATQYQQMYNLVQAQYLVLQGRQVRPTADNQARLKQETVIQLLMDRKVKELGIHVSNEEVLQQIQALSILQDRGRFDPERYRQLIIQLNNYGIDEVAFEEVMRTQLLHTKLQQWITSGVKATPIEVQQAYLPLHEMLTIDLVEFDVANQKQSVTVSNEEARAYYEQNKESFRTPAKVKVRYARFPIEDTKKTLKLADDEITEFYERNKFKYAGTNSVAPPLDAVRKEVCEELLKIRADRATGDRATELTVKLVHPEGTAKTDFTKVSSEMGVVVKETDRFTVGEKIAGIEDCPEFTQKAFALTADQPISDPIAGTDAYYVLEYVASQPSEIPAFEEVQTRATEQMRQLRLYEATLKQGRETVDQLKKLIAAGRTFAGACAELKLKVETPTPFTISDEKPKLPSAGRIQQATLSMPAGAISEFIPTVSGGVVFYLRNRQPADPAEFEKDKEQTTRQILQRNRQALFNNWIQALVRAEQVDFKIPPRPQETEEADGTVTQVSAVAQPPR